MTSLAVGCEDASSGLWVEEEFTVPLRPALRSTASPQTVLRGTVNPSSRWHSWGATDRSPGYGGGAGQISPSSARGPLSLAGAGADSHLPAKVLLRPSRARRLPTHPPKPPPSPGGRCSAPKNTLEGEGSMVLRRAVRGRRPWSEALTGGGPSIPLLPTCKRSPNRWTTSPLAGSRARPAHSRRQWLRRRPPYHLRACLKCPPRRARHRHS